MLGRLSDEKGVAILADDPHRRLAPSCPCGASSWILVLGRALLFAFGGQQRKDLLRGEAKLGDELLYATKCGCGFSFLCLGDFCIQSSFRGQ